MTRDLPKYLAFAAALAGVLGSLSSGCVAPAADCSAAGAYLGDSASCPSTLPVNGSACTAMETCSYCNGDASLCTTYCVCAVPVVDAGANDVEIADGSPLDAGSADVQAADAGSADTAPALAWRCGLSCPIGGPAFPPDLPSV